MPNEQKHDNLNRFSVGMTYVPWQIITKVYDNPEEAFEKGSLFPDLYYPFTGSKTPNHHPKEGTV